MGVRRQGVAVPGAWAEWRSHRAVTDSGKKEIIKEARQEKDAEEDCGFETELNVIRGLDEGFTVGSNKTWEVELRGGGKIREQVNGGTRLTGNLRSIPHLQRRV